MPVFTVSETASPGPGFSTKARTRPSAAGMTSPYSSGSGTRVSTIVASASCSRWKARAAERSRSVTPSPESTQNVSSRKSAACRMPPAVPRGVRSV